MTDTDCDKRVDAIHASPLMRRAVEILSRLEGADELAEKITIAGVPVSSGTIGGRAAAGLPVPSGWSENAWFAVCDRLIEQETQIALLTGAFDEVLHAANPPRDMTGAEVCDFLREQLRAARAAVALKMLAPGTGADWGTGEPVIDELNADGTMDVIIPGASTEIVRFVPMRFPEAER